MLKLVWYFFTFSGTIFLETKFAPFNQAHHVFPLLPCWLMCTHIYIFEYLLFHQMIFSNKTRHTLLIRSPPSPLFLSTTSTYFPFCVVQTDSASANVEKSVQINSHWIFNTFSHSIFKSNQWYFRKQLSLSSCRFRWHIISYIKNIGKFHLKLLGILPTFAQFFCTFWTLVQTHSWLFKPSFRCIQSFRPSIHQ